MAWNFRLNSVANLMSSLKPFNIPFQCDMNLKILPPSWLCVVEKGVISSISYLVLVSSKTARLLHKDTFCKYFVQFKIVLILNYELCCLNFKLNAIFLKLFFHISLWCCNLSCVKGFSKHKLSDTTLTPIFKYGEFPTNTHFQYRKPVLVEIPLLKPCYWKPCHWKSI